MNADRRRARFYGSEFPTDNANFEQKQRRVVVERTQNFLKEFSSVLSKPGRPYEHQQYGWGREIEKAVRGVTENSIPDPHTNAVRAGYISHWQSPASAEAATSFLLLRSSSESGAANSILVGYRYADATDHAALFISKYRVALSGHIRVDEKFAQAGDNAPRVRYDRTPSAKELRGLLDLTSEAIKMAPQDDLQQFGLLNYGSRGVLSDNDQWYL